MANTIEQ